MNGYDEILATVADINLVITYANPESKHQTPTSYPRKYKSS